MRWRLPAALLAVVSILAGPPAVADPAMISAADARADFVALYAGLRQAHYDLYAHRSKADYDRLYEAMLAGFDRSMTRPELETRYQVFTAYGRVAHARIETGDDGWEAYREGGGKAFPLQVRLKGDRAWVAGRLGPDQGAAPGDELLSVDGIPMAAVIVRAARTLSADTDDMRNAMLETGLPRRLWLEQGSRERFQVVLRKPDGRRASVTLRATSRAEAMTAPTPATFALDPDLREARMLSGDVAYLRPGPFYNNVPGARDMWDNTAFVAFIDKAFEAFLAAGAGDLLIDLRDNPGGDNSFSDPMVAWFATERFRFFSRFEIKVSPQTTASNEARIAVSGRDGASGLMAALYEGARPGEIVLFDLPHAEPRPGKRFEGRVWLLVNRRSYSNTVTVAALTQDYGFGKVLGEATSDLATTYGAMETFTLPRTGIVVGYPKALIVRPSGDRTSRGVTPDIAIATPLLPSEEDEVLAAALATIRRQP